MGSDFQNRVIDKKNILIDFREAVTLKKNTRISVS